MKKIKGLVLVLIMLTLTLVPSFSDGENETTLEIVAYKVGEPYLKLAITDAINESLEEITDPLLSQAGGGEVTTLEEINLTEHVDELIESYGSSSPKVIFSYRVVGNTTGSYTVSISISPLSSNGKTIATQHGLVNKNEIFQSSSASTITNSNGRFSIEQGEAGVLTPDQSDGGNTELTYTWTVNGPDADTIPVWIARGAVTMGIDPVTYEDAPFGTYTSQVTVKLTTP